MTWVSVRVELLAGGPVGRLWPPPGRVLAVGPRHTFRDLARAVDAAFARWDTRHLWEFVLADGRRVGQPDTTGTRTRGRCSTRDASRSPPRQSPGWPSATSTTWGARWVHRCTVEDAIDPVAVLGMRPDRPAAYAGWGAIPDQYGRTFADDDGESPPPLQPADPDPMLSLGWPRVRARRQLHGSDLPELRGATARRDREAVRSLLTGRGPGGLLQHAGDALLAVGAGALPDIARDVEARLRERGDDGDDELADALAGALGGTVPALRPIPVLLDEVADLVSGDPSRDTGGWIDLRTGEVWDASGLDWMDADERPDFDDEPEIRAEWFGFGDERERGRARALLAARGYAPAPRLD